MNRFSLFSILYMVSFLLDQFEEWERVILTLAALGLVSISVTLGVKRVNFAVFLIFTTADIFLFRFPDLSNHGNIFLYCNLILLVGLIYTWIRQAKFPTDDDFYEMMRPSLRVALIVVYFFAGFHKFNADFFNPLVSCAGEFTLGRMTLMLTSDVLGIPTTLVLPLFLVGVLWLLFRSSPRSLLKTANQRRSLLLAIALSSVAIAIIMAPVFIPADWDAGISFLVIATATMIILWECVGAILLLFPKAQLYVLLFSWLMHLMLSLIGFVDFSSLATALLFTFIPDNYSQKIIDSAPISLFNRSIHRIHFYFILNVIAGVINGIHQQIYPLFSHYRVVAGLFFIVASLVLVWPLLIPLVDSAERSPWKGVPVFSQAMPKFMLVFSVMLVLFGLTSYFGLRTAGNFSMFSNLRTEGQTSNHFLLGQNPLKIWNYQEDLVKILEVDPEAASVSSRIRQMEGNFLPRVEFQKLIVRASHPEKSFPIWTFEYQGKTYHDIDLDNNPLWQLESPTWEMKLMDFRTVQVGGANRCRW